MYLEPKIEKLLWFPQSINGRPEHVGKKQLREIQLQAEKLFAANWSIHTDIGKSSNI